MYVAENAFRPERVRCDSARLSTAAPAPSPNSTHVERSVQSMIELIRSEPTTSTVSADAGRDQPFGDRRAVDEARARRADVERRGARRAELGLQVDGGGRKQPIGRRGAEDDASISPGGDAGALHGLSRGGGGHRAGRSRLPTAMCRSRMPVRSTIHSSFVSRPSAAKSWFVMIFAGMPRPVPAMYAIGRFMPRRSSQPATDVLVHARSRPPAPPP